MVSEIAVGGLVDPETIVVEDPLDSVPGHAGELIGANSEEKSQTPATELGLETVKKRHEDSGKAHGSSFSGMGFGFLPP